MKRFCLLTSGRTGSTALMDALAQYPDIAVPHKQVDCIDNEILHPERVAQYAKQYQELSGLPVRDELSLIHAFYECNRNSPYAGFKSMPERHRHLKELSEQDNMQLITLRRGDIASTIASFLAAFDAGTWRREGGSQQYRFHFGPDYERRAIGHLRYVERCHRHLDSLTRAIHLTYEELCSQSFVNSRLDEFFGRHIKLLSPKPPTSGGSYVENWEAFQEFIIRHMQRAAG